MGEVIVKLEDVVKRFGEVVAVDHVSVEVFAGEFFSILGPSGCGKTTMLRLIAGLEHPDFGAVYLDGELVNLTPPYRRNVNTVFQSYALFPHMNVYENVAFGLKVKKVNKSDRKERIFKALDLVGLPEMSSRKPGHLSGGERQRVALARALVNEPSVLLLDEPLGALDLKLRKQMQIELKSLQKKLRATFIYVTHDQEESLTMSDRIAVMRSGRLEQVGNPSQIYEEPRTEFVANFIGTSNIFSGKLRKIGDSSFVMATPDGLEIKVPNIGNGFPESATVMVRPERIQITSHKPETNYNVFRAKVEEVIYLGTVFQFIIDLNGRSLTVLEKNYDREQEFKANQEVFVSWEISSTVMLSEN